MKNLEVKAFSVYRIYYPRAWNKFAFAGVGLFVMSILLKFHIKATRCFTIYYLSIFTQVLCIYNAALVFYWSSANLLLHHITKIKDNEKMVR